MKLSIGKFGSTLTSRQAGREAFAAIQPLLTTIDSNELIEVDFDDVLTFSPSWGDEVITALKNKFGDRVILKKSENPSVIATLELLDEIHNAQ